MNQIAVFGASGRTGKLFTELALKNGYKVQALVRDPSKLGSQHSNLQVIQGDVFDPGKVAETIDKAEVVVNLIGPGKDSPLNLLIDYIQAKVPLYLHATRNILNTMQQNNVKRLIVLTGVIPDPNDKLTFMNKFMLFLAKKMLRALVEDGLAQVDLIKQSDMDWTIVRSPMLTDQPSQGKYRVGYLDANTGKSTSRSDAATFLLDVLMNGKYIRQMPLISN